MYLRQGHMPPRLLALSDSTEGYRSGHNEAVLKICEHSGRKNAEKPCKH